MAFNQRTHRFPNTRFVEGDAERLPFADSAFDVVRRDWHGTFRRLRAQQ
ncbi:methyltransferase domain-containing protein [Polyangium jinanense]|uniref:Methyltransferase domain-containing protein n=1 Tax=Polyangium jinanense TaxID=2829994 RepID=A0A9X3XE66_9BACT|nr:methyltransferase domain-containing protein [Polyangium jinanense]MDC3988724.1 methyltransferase domain-containing protein [Polyangium jinanense]